MSIYNYKCTECKKEFESIEKFDTETVECIECGYAAKRIHGQDLPSPPKLIHGVGGFHSPSFGDRKFD